MEICYHVASAFFSRIVPGADPGFFIGRGAPLRNDVTDRWGKRIRRRLHLRAGGGAHVEALIFLMLLLSSCLNWRIYCDDHSSHSSTSAIQIWIISYIIHNEIECYFFNKIEKTYSSCLFICCPFGLFSSSFLGASEVFFRLLVIFERHLNPPPQKRWNRRNGQQKPFKVSLSDSKKLYFVILNSIKLPLNSQRAL